MPRPRRPAQKHRTPRNVEKVVDTQVNWQGLAAEPDPELELERDELEGSDDPLLCDPEEMDLLGEIFDTLSSRSSREHGLLYGTRSLDLFGPDSHDYIIKDRLATPSQESLSLSISGSESLHSWTLEEGLQTPESELAKELDWQCPRPNLNADKETMPVMCTPAEQGRIGETPNKQDEEEEEEEQGDDPEQNVSEVEEKQKEGDVGNNTEVETGQGEGVIQRGGAGKQAGESVETQINRAEEMLQEVHLNNEDTEIGPSQGTRPGPCTESDVGLELAKENQDQCKTNPEIGIYVGEQNDPMSPGVQPTRATSLAIGKQSPATHQSVMLQKQSQTKLWRLINSNNSSCVQGNQTESTEEEVLKVVKVSELKKRFEA